MDLKGVKGKIKNVFKSVDVVNIKACVWPGNKIMFI